MLAAPAAWVGFSLIGPCLVLTQKLQPRRVLNDRHGFIR
jgi:hypothetical protein